MLEVDSVTTTKSLRRTYQVESFIRLHPVWIVSDGAQMSKSFIWSNCVFYPLQQNSWMSWMQTVVSNEQVILRKGYLRSILCHMSYNFVLGSPILIFIFLLGLLGTFFSFILLYAIWEHTPVKMREMRSILQSMVVRLMANLIKSLNPLR